MGGCNGAALGTSSCLQDNDGFSLVRSFFQNCRKFIRIFNALNIDTDYFCILILNQENPCNPSI